MQKTITAFGFMLALFWFLGCGDGENRVSDPFFSEGLHDSLVGNWTELQSRRTDFIDSVKVNIDDSMYTFLGEPVPGGVMVEGDMLIFRDSVPVLEEVDVVSPKMELVPGFHRSKQRVEIRQKVSEIKKSVIRLTGVATSFYLWPIKDSVIQIPYRIETVLPHPKRVQDAFRLWEETGLVKFIPATTETAYVLFVASGNTSSEIGYRKRVQEVNISPPATAGNVAHEIGHVLGLFHEHSRSDRDQYVDVLCDTEVNYRFARKEDPSAIDFLPYDFYSIMHYPRTACMAIRISGLPADIPGQRKRLSRGDVETVRMMYSTPKKS